MKLNNSQIKALANTIIDKLRDLRNEENKALYASEEYINFANTNPYCIQLKEIKAITNCREHYINSLIDDIKEIHFKDSLSKVKIPAYNTLENELILQTIIVDENNTIDNIINNLVEKYK